ncbi:nucleotide exchange factor GrpE [Ktedonospora formicarum]|uniref:Protein GrpE n=1 Tax=Ktedonospora formicarum TaxID=2778364 RepID=A0A8J3MN57_9CHLR|nr:nucleotide exchange factor GrpE [Ktedonospora formicarum]GHO42357.1 protein GrpE [Ktedonospora formicarum]
MEQKPLIKGNQFLSPKQAKTQEKSKGNKDVSDQPTMRTEAVAGQGEQGANGDYPAPEVAALERELADAQRQAGEYLNMSQRIQADFVNFKRRAAQEQTDSRAQAQAQLLEQLLPVLDDLGRAMLVMPAELAQNPWAQGIQIAARQLNTTLQQLGLRQIGTPGEPFNPQWHEALMQEPRPDQPEGSVVQVFRPGYALGERIIRPAQVTVAGPATNGQGQ